MISRIRGERRDRLQLGAALNGGAGSAGLDAMVTYVFRSEKTGVRLPARRRLRTTAAECSVVWSDRRG
jgi:hypothetical protein